MELLGDPRTWVSFLTLVLLEIVLGIDNIIFLSVLVDRLPKVQRGSARVLGLGFAMLTRIGLLFSVTWLATLRDPLFRALGTDVSGRDLILFAGGLFLIVKDRKSTRLNSSHTVISYAVFCLKKKKNMNRLHWN